MTRWAVAGCFALLEAVACSAFDATPGQPAPAVADAADGRDARLRPPPPPALGTDGGPGFEADAGPGSPPCDALTERFEPTAATVPWTPDGSSWSASISVGGSLEYDGFSASGRLGSMGRVRALNVQDASRSVLARSLTGGCWRGVEAWIDFVGVFDVADAVKFLRLSFGGPGAVKDFALVIEGGEVVLSGPGIQAVTLPLPGAGYERVALTVAPTGAISLAVGPNTAAATTPGPIGEASSLEIGLFNGAVAGTGTKILFDDVTLF